MKTSTMVTTANTYCYDYHHYHHAIWW